MKRQQRQTRRGTIMIMAAIMTIVLLAMVAFSVDLGYVLTAKEELQRTADASALAACWDYGKSLSQGQTYAVASQAGRTTASNYASYNKVTKNPAANRHQLVQLAHGRRGLWLHLRPRRIGQQLSDRHDREL